MRKHILILPDGTEISSGAPGAAVMSVQLTGEVNTGALLLPGAVSATMLQLSLLSPDYQLRAGDSLRLYTDQRRPLGIFIAQEPVTKGALQTVTAYDRLILLDRDIAPFLQTLSWPQGLHDLARSACEFCGLTLENTEFPMGEFPVSLPTGSLTGRQLLGWIAQAAGCFVRATPEGTVELSWYTPAPLEVCPEKTRVLGGVLRLAGKAEDGAVRLQGRVEAGVLTLTQQQYALANGIALETAPILPIDRVQLRQTDADVGLVYPDAPGENTLVIQGNPLLAAQDAQTLLPVAEHLYSRFAGITYTPGTLRLPVTEELRPGQMLPVTDSQGNRHTVYIMQLQRTAAGDTVTCAGSYSRDSATVRNNRSYADLQGKLLQLRTDVDGIKAENSDSRGKLSALTLDVEGIRGTVSQQEGLSQRLTTLEQSAQGLRLSVESIQTQGATRLKTAMGYTFDDEGLSIARSGEPMENRLDNTGMQVLRSGTPILQADHRGVNATDVTVRNYLILGDHARIENYAGGRTACFYLEG